MAEGAQKCWYNTPQGAWRIINHEFHYDVLVVETEATGFEVGDAIVRRFVEVHGERFGEILIYMRLGPPGGGPYATPPSVRTRRLRWLRDRGVDLLEFDS